MKNILIKIALVIVSCGALFVSHSYAATSAEVFPTYPAVNYNSGVASPDVIKKGEYLAKMGDCLGCHTEPTQGAKAFAGGYQFPTPFGVIVSSNITPDKATGIGAWTQAEFIKAVKEGVRPNGDYLFPVMPYNYYHAVPDEDMAAIYAYMMSVPAVNYQVPDNEMMWPFGWRFLQIGWRTLYFNAFNKFPVMTDDPTQSAEWNRGRFIVEGLAHCNECHTPQGPLGNPKMKYKLTGNLIEGYYAPNITGSRLKDTPIQDIVDVFHKNKMLAGGPVQGPMLEANEDSFKYLSTADITAIAIYLKALDIPSPPAKKGGMTGAELYNSVCASCHTTGGSGAPILGDKAEWAKRMNVGGINHLYSVAINGIGSMPPKGTCVTCTNAEIDSAVDYIIQTTENSKGVEARKATAPTPITYSAAKGKQVYEAQCASCHNKGVDGAPVLGDVVAWTPILQKQLDVLFSHAIYGYGKMPAKRPMLGKDGKYTDGYCPDCSNEDIEQAVIYMANKGGKNVNYGLW
jgi:cytochrome c5